MTSPAVDFMQIRKQFVVVLGLIVILPTMLVASSHSPSNTVKPGSANGKYVIPPSFYGMYLKSSQESWPTSYFANLGLEEQDAVAWSNIEVAPGVYDFYYLDRWIAEAQAHKVSVTYTFNAVPQFYSSIPSDDVCALAPGACDPPRDLSEDGSGTNTSFKNFVYAIVKHNSQLGNPIQAWNLWNAPNLKKTWTPTCESQHDCAGNLRYAQLLRMASDAYTTIKSANPDAVVLTPSPVGWPHGAEEWMNAWLKFGGGKYADVIAFDGYVNQSDHFPIAENETKLIEQMKLLAKQYKQDGKPLWVNSGGWGNVNKGSTEVMKTAFLARYMLLQQSEKIAQAYWHQWDDLFDNDHLRLAGEAYNSIVNWTTGATLTTACRQLKGTSIWACDYSRSNPVGYKGQVVWNAEKSSSYRFSKTFVQYCDLKGKVKTLRGITVPIGIWPILLENKNLGTGACKQ